MTFKWQIKIRGILRFDVLTAKTKLNHFIGQLVFAPTPRVNDDNLAGWQSMALDKLRQYIDMLVFIQQIATDNDIKLTKMAIVFCPV